MYHLPLLSKRDFGVIRSPGPGLGNLLFPVSRALIGQNRFGGTFVYPTFRQVKFRSILRNDRDYRTYGGLFRNRSTEDWRQWASAKRAKRFLEENSHEIELTDDSSAVVYSGLGRYFHDLVGYEALISEWVTSNANLSGSTQQYDIGIHIRLGDFSPADSQKKGHSIRQPMDWYRRAHAEACKLVNVKNPVTYLFTDDNPAQVMEELGLPNVRIDPSKNAISAITNLSRAKVIVTSRSTFSTWAVYLGNRAAVWSVDFDFSTTIPVRSGLDFSIE